jgi:hypothetical protein
MRIPSLMCVLVAFAAAGCVTPSVSSVQKVQNEVATRALGCRERHWPTAADAARCINLALIDATKMNRYPFMDLIYAYTDQNLLLAEGVDTGAISSLEAEFLLEQAGSRLVGQEAARIMERLARRPAAAAALLDATDQPYSGAYRSILAGLPHAPQ